MRITSSRGRHGLAGLGLLVPAVAAPTGFAYPGNLVLLVLAVTELIVAERPPVGGGDGELSLGPRAP